MTPLTILAVFVVYTTIVFSISRLTARKADNESYFVGNRNSPWYVVAYGMIGASLSGVTFMSVPGLVKGEQFSYMMLVFGYLVGYFVIAFVLLPLYYKLNLISIYSYLEKRFGILSLKTGSFFFMLSRLIGASFRMFLVVSVLQLFVFDSWGVPMAFTVFLIISFLLLYTFKGGIKTVVWTDTLQTTFMLSAVVITIFLVSNALNMNLGQLFSAAKAEGFTNMIVTDFQHPRFFLKQFLAGIFITIVMTGLDQDMMQKNLSCRTLKDARKNVLTFGVILIPVNLMFLFLGAVLWLYADQMGISMMRTSDELFPTIALNYLGVAAGITFFFGLVSAAYSSIDGTLTALTTTFCIDFLGLKRKPGITEEKIKQTRYVVHASFAVLVMIIIWLYGAINNDALISRLFTIAGYTYGPLLGLFAFGMFTKRSVKDRLVPYIAVASPIVSYLINLTSERLFWGYKFGFEILLLNGLITIIGLFAISKK